jgi:hypothetical protein
VTASLLSKKARHWRAFLSLFPSRVSPAISEIMAKRPNDMKGAERVPTRQQVLAFMKEAAANPRTAKVGKRDIAKAFGIKGQGRIALKALLKELEAEGAVEKRGKHLHKPGQLPTMTLVDITSKDRDGDLIARPVEWEADAYGKPPIVHVHLGRPRPGQPQPKVGDRVLMRVEPTNESLTVYRGRPVKIFEKHKVETLGQFRSAPMGGGRVMPVDKKSLGREIMIPPGSEKDAEDGDLVAVTTHRKNKLGLVHMAFRTVFRMRRLLKRRPQSLRRCAARSRAKIGAPCRLSRLIRRTPKIMTMPCMPKKILMLRVV